MVVARPAVMAVVPLRHGQIVGDRDREVIPFPLMEVHRVFELTGTSGHLPFLDPRPAAAGSDLPHAIVRVMCWDSDVCGIVRSA